MVENASLVEPVDEYTAKLKAARVAAGMSLREAAQRLGDGTHFTTLGKVEAGKISLSVEWIMKLSALYGVTPADIVLPEAAQGSGRNLPVFQFTDKELVPEHRSSWRQFGWFFTGYGGDESFVLLDGQMENNASGLVEYYAVIDPSQTRLRFKSIYALRLGDGTLFVGRHTQDGAGFDGISWFSPGYVEIGLTPFLTLGRAVMVAEAYSY